MALPVPDRARATSGPVRLPRRRPGSTRVPGCQGPGGGRPGQRDSAAACTGKLQVSTTGGPAVRCRGSAGPAAPPGTPGPLPGGPGPPAGARALLASVADRVDRLASELVLVT